MTKFEKMLESKNFMLFLGFLGLYLVTTGVSLAGFTFLFKTDIDLGKQTDSSGRPSRIDLSKPKTEECPINGAYFTKEERQNWETKRPIVVMVENSVDARPQSGLSKADVVYEAVAEGGITRFMPVFYCNTASEEVKVAPVRSVRIYFLSYAMEYGLKPIFMHVGGANDYAGSGDTVKEVRALEYLESIGWRTPRGNDFDTTYDSAYPVFWRNYERLGRPVATEHTMMASLDAAYEQAKKRGLEFKDKDGKPWNSTFESWKFVDGKPKSSNNTEISFSYWSNKPDFDVTWKYNKENNKYLRFTAGAPHMDFENNTQLSAENVVVLFAKEKGPVDRNMHMMYTVTGKGEAIVFQNGVEIKANWSKLSSSDRLKLTDAKGQEIPFVRGQIWFQVVPSGNAVNY